MCYLGILVLAVLLKVAGTWGLRNVTLLISPLVVERGKNVELFCKYDLEGEPLYSIKFYRGNHEFYRYSPMDVPPIKLFPFPGLRVDLSLSQDNTVLLQGADYSLGGNITCEVSTDAPQFSTKMATKVLSVVELPKTPPQIHTNVSKLYEAEDQLRATCTSAPARPAPSLTWFINDEPAMTTATRWNRSGLLETCSVTLDVRVLPRHVTTGLVLKCTAVVADIYKETAYLPLPTTAAEPKHEKVLSSHVPALQSPNVPTMLLITTLLFLR